MAAKRPDESGLQHFEAAAKTQEETSSDAEFSSYKDAGPLRFPEDGHLVLQKRGEPKE